jgi:hypothetical protein
LQRSKSLPGRVVDLFQVKLDGLGEIGECLIDRVALAHSPTCPCGESSAPWKSVSFNYVRTKGSHAVYRNQYGRVYAS